MNLRTMPVGDLKPAPYNPRLKLKPGDTGWRRLERSLDEFDLVQPVVWNERTGHVVAGHQRVAVLQHRGVTKIECVVVDLPLEKEKALNVTLNNSGVGSDWDAARLVDLVQELQSLPDFDATLTGFDEQQLRDLVLAPASQLADSNEEAGRGGEAGMVTVQLQVPEERFETVETWLNELLAEEAEVRLHVRRGGG